MYQAGGVKGHPRHKRESYSSAFAPRDNIGYILYEYTELLAQEYVIMCNPLSSQLWSLWKVSESNMERNQSR
jgi:hypothetical protein